MRFHGNIGYADSKEIAPGVWEDVITERTYYGDVVKNYNRVQSTEALVEDVVFSNNVSIVADAYAFKKFYQIRYVELNGVRWKVTNVEVQRPRLILTLGGVYK